MEYHRRRFLKSSGLLAASFALRNIGMGGAEPSIQLLEGAAPVPLPFRHFPDRLHALVWRNWTLVPIARIAEVMGATKDQVLAVGQRMGLPPPPTVTLDQQRRSYVTVIRRNWHLLPYDQLLQLLGWTADHLAYILREDDFLFIKLGSSKPKCPRLAYAAPDAKVELEARRIADVVHSLPDGWFNSSDPLFGFVPDLSATSSAKEASGERSRAGSPRFCYSYFALYGDPLLETQSDPYPDGYLSKLAAIGVNGVWLQAVLHKLAPFPWLKESDTDRDKRLRNLQALARRAAKQGVGIYLYLNEPRAMPLGFFKEHPELKGVVEGDYATLCTSQSAVQRAIGAAVAYLCRAVPELAGFFTISASENLTNCWSHGGGAKCPLCGKRTPAEVIAEINTVFQDGIKQAGSKADLLIWDWGWRDEWAEEIIQRLPSSAALMSVSEWSIPIRRGGVDSIVGEYSISTIGPGPRATRHWDLARKRGLRRIAKIQAGNTWELSATPSIPALENVARHVARLREAEVDGLMLGWTLGGYPSPNLQVACEIATAPAGDMISIEARVEQTLHRVAKEWFGEVIAPAVVEAWQECSRAFSEFPFHSGLVYNAPMQFGPSNLLWATPTGYRSTMVGFPYDDLEGWRQSYPVQVFVGQFTKVADGFERAVSRLREAASGKPRNPAQQKALGREIDVATAAAIHFRSTANQARFVQLRETAKANITAELIQELRKLLRSEIGLSTQLLEIQQRDSRIGFEASNQYYYVPQDLVEKVLNCNHLIDTWLPTLEMSAGDFQRSN